MIDLIKEFNMIDLLGMLLPGCLVTILFGNEFNVIENTNSYLNIELSTGAILTLLLLVGYCIGMLLHEIGDVVEKMLYSNPLLNPRTYAAINTGYAAYFYEKHRLDRPNNQMNRDSICLLPSLCAIGIIILCTIKYFCNIQFPTLLKWAIIICITSVLITKEFRSKLFMWYIKRMPNNASGTWHSASWKNIKITLNAICKDNVTFTYAQQSNFPGEEEYFPTVMRKRDLFDGYKAMSRNLFLAMLLLGVYGSCTQQGIASLRNWLLDSNSKIILACIVQISLGIRYCHYSYIRPKYRYEDILDIERRGNI